MIFNSVNFRATFKKLSSTLSSTFFSLAVGIKSQVLPTLALQGQSLRRGSHGDCGIRAAQFHEQASSISGGK